MQYILMQYALQHTIRIQRNMPMQKSDFSHIAGLTRKSLLQKDNQEITWNHETWGASSNLQYWDLITDANSWKKHKQWDWGNGRDFISAINIYNGMFFNRI